MKGKKNEFVFTIGFKRTDPEHVRVVNILNETGSKNQFIVDAVLCYVDSGYMNVRPWNIHPAFTHNDEQPIFRNQTEMLENEAEEEMDGADIDDIRQSLEAFRRV